MVRSYLPRFNRYAEKFDEGLISGILSEFYNSDYITVEKSCRGTGDKSCLYKSFPIKQ